MVRTIARRGAFLAFAATALAGTSAAQGFNIDVGDNLILFPAPADAFGAAAGQIGHWMGLPTPYTATLEGLDGGPSAVSVASDAASAANYFQSGLAGEEQKLLEDSQWTPNLATTVTWTFTGLANGAYQVYTYAWSASGGAMTEIAVAGSSDPPQVVTGVWTGLPFQQGVTHALHDVVVTDGSLIVTALGVGPFGLDSGALNGFQLVPGGGATVGSSYCVSTQNSSGSPATITGLGSESISANNLTLRIDDVPTTPGIGIPIAGPTQAQNPFFNGFLCIDSQGLQRVNEIIAPTASGTVIQPLDYTGTTSGTVPLNVVAGQSYHYQYWFRDPNAGGGNANFSDGLEVAHTP